MSNNTSQHILNTAATLLGFCLVVITSLHIADKTAASIIDEVTSIIALLLSTSCFFSFFSIRSKNPAIEQKFETIAEYIFIISLGGIIVIILLIMFNLIN